MKLEGDLVVAMCGAVATAANTVLLLGQIPTLNLKATHMQAGKADKQPPTAKLYANNICTHTLVLS
jgi:hypothetical protein